MDRRSLIILSLLLSTSIPTVVAQSSIAIGIQWSGFSTDRQGTGPHPIAADPVTDPAYVMHDLPPIPSPYSYHALGIFCKAEVKLNSLLPFPVMMRLGDVRRAEELDGKGHPLITP